MAQDQTSDLSAKALVRVVVASPDRSRVLARPAGLAGWRLPAIAVAAPRNSVEEWTAAELSRAHSVIGGPASPWSRLAVDVWEFVATGRVSPAGRAWICSTDAERFGSDASAVRRWSLDEPDRIDGPSIDGATPR